MLISDFRFFGNWCKNTWHEMSEKKFTQRRSQHTRWPCQMRRKWRSWGEDKSFTENVKVSGRKKEEEKQLLKKIQVSLILIRNLKGKTGKDSWVQVMATQAGSAWNKFYNEFTVLLGSLPRKQSWVVWIPMSTKLSGWHTWLPRKQVKNNLFECQ